MPDYDAIVIGSGFGGAITACRLAEAGYKVCILERGRRWSHDAAHADFFPRDLAESRWLWRDDDPAKFHGWLDLRVFPNMSVAQGRPSAADRRSTPMSPWKRRHPPSRTVPVFLRGRRRSGSPNCSPTTTLLQTRCA
ncbi:MAG: NAD(P)-binding protein [Planctomycetaceae bacterium]